MQEIIRVLKKDGIFLVVNGYPKQGTKWWNFVRFKNDGEYKDVFIKYGFKEAAATIDKNTIIIRVKAVQAMMMTPQNSLSQGFFNLFNNLHY